MASLQQLRTIVAREKQYWRQQIYLEQSVVEMLENLKPLRSASLPRIPKSVFFLPKPSPLGFRPPKPGRSAPNSQHFAMFCFRISASHGLQCFALPDKIFGSLWRHVLSNTTPARMQSSGSARTLCPSAVSGGSDTESTNARKPRVAYLAMQRLLIHIFAL